MSSAGKRKVKKISAKGAKTTSRKTVKSSTKTTKAKRKTASGASATRVKKKGSTPTSASSRKASAKKSGKRVAGKTSTGKKTPKATAKRKVATKKAAKTKKGGKKTPKGASGKAVKKRQVKKKKGAPPIPEVEQDGIDEAEVSALQKEIIRLQDSVESTIDDRRHVDVEMSKLDRKVKIDKALAIDQHHQKISQVDEMIEDIIDVLYDYEEQLEGFSIFVDTSVAELFEDLKADLNEEISQVEKEAEDCTKVIPALQNDVKSLLAKKEDLEDELKERLAKQNEIKLHTDDLQTMLKEVSSSEGLEAMKTRNEKLKSEVKEDEALLAAAREGALGGAKGADPAKLKKLRNKNARLEIQITGLNSLLAEASAGLAKTKNIKKLQAANDRLRDHQEELEVLLADAATKLKTTKPEVMSPSTKARSEEQMETLKRLRDELGEERNRKKDLNSQLLDAQNESGKASGDVQNDTTLKDLELRKKLADLQKKLSKAKKNAKKKRRESVSGKSPPKKVKPQANSEVAKAMKERGALKREIKRLKGILTEDTDKSQKKDIKSQKKLQAALEAEQQALDGRKERLASQKEELAKIDLQAEAGSESLGALEEKFEAMEQKIKELNATKDERDAKIDHLRQKVNRMKKRGRSLKKLGRNFERQMSEIKADSAQVKKVMRKHIQGFTPFLKKQIAHMKVLVRKQKQDYKDAKTNFKRENKAKLKLKKTLENDFDVADHEFAKLERKVDDLIRKEKRLNRRH